MKSRPAPISTGPLDSERSSLVEELKAIAAEPQPLNTHWRQSLHSSVSKAWTVIPVPSERVFAMVSDPSTYPTWLAGAKRIVDVDRHWPAEGASFRHVVGLGPVRVHDVTTARFCDGAHTLILEVRARPLGRGVVMFRVHDASNDARPATLIEVYETPHSPGLRMLRPAVNAVLRLRNSASLRHLRSLLVSADGPSGAAA